MQSAFPPLRLPLPLRLSCACAALACAGAAQAAPALDWSLGGFGSAGVVHASSASADFTSSVMKHSGAGRSQRWSPHVDSRLGVQLDLAAGQRWSGVLQAISEQRSDGSYRPVLEWANIKYQAGPDLSLRAGRIALPMFLAADYRKVGYAHPWVRTPVEAYNAVPLTSSDGVDASYRWNRGALKNTTQVFFGRTKKALWDNATLEAHGVAGLSHTTGYRHATLRVAAVRATMTMDLARPLFDAYRQFGAAGAAVASRFDFDHKRVSAMSAGLNYDPGSWFLTGELGRIRTSSHLGDSHTAYASAGYRVGDFTPYLGGALIDPGSAAGAPGLATGAMAPQAAQAAARLNGQLEYLLAGVPAQSTLTLGTRWDLHPGMALKLQYDRVRPRAGSRGMLINVDAGFVAGRPLHVASAVLDFVF